MKLARLAWLLHLPSIQVSCIALQHKLFINRRLKSATLLARYC